MPKLKKKWGQHFLRDEEILRKIVGAVGIKPGERVVEIGAGTGNLTFFLAQTGGQILALEKDRDLIKKLNKRVGRFKNVKIVCADARFFNYQGLDNYKVIGNLPYNISSFILRRLLTLKNQPKIMVLMIQKEVGERLLSPPGKSQRGLLTILLELTARAKILQKVERDKFLPMPQVDSVVIKIIPQIAWTSEQERLFKFIKLGFANKRRQIINSLAGAFAQDKKIVYNILQSAKINPQVRAEDLTLKEWKKLYAKVKKRTKKSS